MAEEKSYGLFIFGCCLLILVDFLWTLSSILVQELLDNYYDKPIIITYCSTSVFALYIPIFYSVNFLRTLYNNWRLKQLTASQLDTFHQAEQHHLDNSPSNYYLAGETTALIQVTSSSDNFNTTTTRVEEVPSSNNNSTKSKKPKDPLKHLNNFEIDALPGSSLYAALQTRQILQNERGWTVFYHNFKVACILGPLWYTMNVTYNSALKMVSVATNSILSTTSGFFVLLISVLVFCTSVRKLHLVCVAVAILGSFFVTYLGADTSADDDVTRGPFDKIVGPALSLLSAFLYGLYSVVIEYFTDKEKPPHEQKEFIAQQRKDAEEDDERERHLARLEASNLGVFKDYAEVGHDPESQLHHPHEYKKFTIHVDGNTDEITQVQRHTQQVSCCEGEDEFNSNSLDSDDEEDDFTDIDPSTLPAVPVNLDPTQPKITSGLLFGSIGLVNLVFAWPFIGLFHFTGFETISPPPTRAIPILIANSCLGAALSDSLWAMAVTITSPIIATLTIPGTIPLAFAYSAFFEGAAINLWSVLGSCLIVSSSSVVAVNQYHTEKRYDRLTGKYLDKRKLQRAQANEQKRAHRQKLKLQQQAHTSTVFVSDELSNVK